MTNPEPRRVFQHMLASRLRPESKTINRRDAGRIVARPRLLPKRSTMVIRFDRLAAKGVVMGILRANNRGAFSRASLVTIRPVKTSAHRANSFRPLQPNTPLRLKKRTVSARFRSTTQPVPASSAISSSGEFAFHGQHEGIFLRRDAAFTAVSHKIRSEGIGRQITTS